MKRPEQHETDSAADAIFRAAFSKWAITPSERDYGWDYIVEFFKDHESTGVLFAGQLKGSRHTKYSADSSFISQSLEQDAADYLARQLEQSTFLFHADVVANKLFWSAIQLDHKVLYAIEKGETQSLTVRIKTSNLLPDRMDRFLAELTQSKMAVISRVLLGTKPIEFVNAMAAHPLEQKTKVAKDLHEKGFFLELSVADQKRLDGDLVTAIATIQKVVAGASASGYLEIHFNAVIQLGELQVLQLMKSDEPQAFVADKRLSNALELCSIAKRTPRQFHLFAQITRRAAELSVAVHKTFGLLMSWQAHTKRGDDPFWIAVLSFQLQESLVVAHRNYRWALRLAQATARSRYRRITSQPIASIALPIGTLAIVLDSCGFEDAAREYRKSAFELLKFATAVANENGSLDEAFNPVMHARGLERSADGEIFLWVRSIVDQWPEDSQHRKNAEVLIRRWIDRKDGAILDGDIQTTHRQIHHNLLTSSGIDPTVEPWVSRIDLAIKDDDPTRVLLDCHHKTVMQHPRGNPTLVRLGLEWANPKIIACDLHRYALAGRALDNINREFRARYCDTCRDKVPRESGWTYYDNKA